MHVFDLLVTLKLLSQRIISVYTHINSVGEHLFSKPSLTQGVAGCFSVRQPDKWDFLMANFEDLSLSIKVIHLSILSVHILYPLDC
jgi:hypothetical protein